MNIIRNRKKTIIGLILLVIIGIPLTVFLARKQQEIRSRASEPKTQTHATAEDMVLMRNKWRDHLTGDPNINTSDPDIANKISSISNTAQRAWNSMNKDPNRTSLWPDLPTDDNGFGITDTYGRLNSMALAYSTKGSALYQNPQLLADLKTALDWIYAHWYNERTPLVNPTAGDSWYQYEIATPLNLNDIVVFLYDSLPQTAIANYMKAIDHFYPPDQKTGANLAWLVKIVALRSIILKDETRLNQAKNMSLPLFSYETSGDGIYADGSFIQHDSHPYNGHYGNSFLGQIVDLMYIFSGSPYDYNSAKKQEAYDWIKNAYEPLIYKGKFMSMVNGRVVARFGGAGAGGGGGVAGISTYLQLSQILTGPNLAALRSMIKNRLQTDVGGPLRGSITDIVWSKQILNDSSIAGYSPAPLTKVYGSMDRAILKKQDFVLGISMSSSRVSNYESIRNENLKGWYSGDGAIYLLNTNSGQFDTDYWATVNPYRIQGTTVDTMQRSVSSGQSYLSREDFVGGATLNNSSASVAMSLNSWNSSLKAKKSWFLFDNEVVALGAGITSTDSRTIETIVENRKLGTSGNEAFVVNGISEPTNLGWSQDLTSVSWANLAGLGGYYFPTPTNMRAVRESRSGKQSDVDTDNVASGDPLYTRNYLTLWQNHGANPSNGTYSYVILPNQTAAQTQSYASNPDIQIISNNPNLQAVMEKNLNILGINFWRAGNINGITASNPSSIVEKDDLGALDFSASDPTQKQNSISFEIAKSATSVISQDSVITITSLSPTIRFSVNTANALGKSFNIKFNLGTAVTTATPTPRPTSTPTPPPVTGDFDGNRTVDIVDFNIWKNEFTGISGGKRSDANNDGRIDLLDYIIWKNNYR